MKADGSASGLIESFGYALEGVRAAAAGRNFRIQLGFAVLACVLGAIFRVSLLEWALIAVCIGVVLGGECINTAIESLVDFACPHADPLAKRAKDAAAGGVFLASAGALVVGIILFLPRIWEVLF